MKKVKIMIMTLMMCLVVMTSYSQEKLSLTTTNEQSITDINLRLKESSSYLILSSNQSIRAVIYGISTSFLAGLLYNHDSGSANKTIGTAVAIGGGILSLSLGISSIINKRRGYKKLGNLML